MDNTAAKLSTIDVPGQTKSRTLPNGLINDINQKLIIVMVGLPARGKLYLTKKITRYLNWLQYNTKIFNVGNTRRLSKQNKGPAPRPFDMGQAPTTEHDGAFFDPDNKDSLIMRERWAMDTLDQLMEYLTKEDGTVGIFDATNTTKLRRRHVIDAIRKKSPAKLHVKILFLESICTDPRFIHRNIRLKLSGPDYKDKDPVLAMKDFKKRLLNYERAYETLDDEEEEYYESIGENLQYIKIINAGKKIISYNISGFLSSQVVFFMLNFNLNERQIWIACHGETKDTSEGRMGFTVSGSKLTPLGERYSKCLAKFMTFKKKEFRLRQLKKQFVEEQEEKEEIERAKREGREEDIKDVYQPKRTPEVHFSVWLSMLRQTVQSARYFDERSFDVKQLKMLNEMSHGKVNGMTIKGFAQKFPQDFKSYQLTYHDDEDTSTRKKLLYRFPGGESYLDVINRLRPLIVELERLEDHVLLLTHKVVARVLLAYFMNLEREYITELDVPLHCVYVLEPRPYGVDWNMYQYDADVDWFFPVNKADILRKKKRREKIPESLVDLWQKQSPLFYIESPSEPSTPNKVDTAEGGYFAKRTAVHFLENEGELLADEHASLDDEQGEEDGNEYWYYQLDNERDEEGEVEGGERSSDDGDTPHTMSVNNLEVNIKALQDEMKDMN